MTITVLGGSMIYLIVNKILIDSYFFLVHLVQCFAEFQPKAHNIMAGRT